MCATILFNIKSLAMTVITITGVALKRFQAFSAVIHILILGKYLVTVRLRLSPVKLWVWNCGSRADVIDVLSKFVDPCELIAHSEVTHSCSAWIQFAFAIWLVPITVIKVHDLHRLCLFNPPAKIILTLIYFSITFVRIVTLQNWARNLICINLQWEQDDGE